MENETAPSFSAVRKLSLCLNVALSILSVVALLVMVNYLSARHFRRVSLSQHLPTELSPLTQRVLATLTNEIKVIIYFDKQDALYDSVEALLKEYKFTNRRISVETVDCIRDTAAASFIKAKYKLNLQTEQNLIIFDCAGHAPRLVYDSELSELDLKPLMSGKSREIKRTHFKGELLFTSAIAGMINPRALKAYFLQGHGEHRPEGDDGLGYSKFLSVLAENNVQIDTLTNLLGSAEVPADCSLLIIPGPTDPLLNEELDKIDNYLKQGGRAFVWFRQAVYTPGRQFGLEKLMARWGVAVGENVVWDPKFSVAPSRGDLKIRDMKVQNLGSHPLTRPLFYRSGLYMVLPRSIGKARLASTSAGDAPQVDVLAATSPEGRILTDIRKDGDVQPSPTDVKDVQVPLMVAVEKGRIKGVSPDRGLTRMIVVGESVFLNNENITKEANQEFVTHALNWLLARNELLAPLAPRPMKEYKFVISDSQRTAVGLILMLLLPGMVLAMGFLVWLRRRK